MAADGGDAVGKPNAEAPPREIDLMDALVAQIAVSGVPDPMPVVMKAVARERLQGRGARPRIVIDPARNRLRGRSSDRVATLEAQSARQIDLAECAAVKMLDRFDRGARGTELRALLHHALVLVGSAHELASFPEVVRARLLDIHVFARLARP